MSPRPRFLDQPWFRQRTPRQCEDMVDYADPIEHYSKPPAWLCLPEFVRIS